MACTRVPVVEDTSTTGGSALTAVHAVLGRGRRRGARRLATAGGPSSSAAAEGHHKPRDCCTAKRAARLDQTWDSAVGREPDAPDHCDWSPCCWRLCLVGCSSSNHAGAAVWRPGRADRRIAGAAGLEHLGVESALRRRLRADRRRRGAEGSARAARQTRGRSLRALRRAGASDRVHRSGQLRRRDQRARYSRPAVGASPDRLTGTVCLGPLQDQARSAGCTATRRATGSPTRSAAYPAAFPVGLLPTNGNDTGLVLKTTSLSSLARRRHPARPAQLGDPAAFNGNGYMLLGLEIDGSRRDTATTPPAAAAR